jgi:pimeloyl-ACP methyl ester carboxylesterase
MNSVCLAPAIPGTHECWADVSGYRMRYLRAGSGPPLLLIHGLLGYSFSWRFTIPALSDLRTMYAPDLLGTGFSDRISGLTCGARACAERMVELMDGLGIDSVDLVGTSHGGGVAVLMATMAPERVRKLVLVAPVNPWSPHGKLITRMIATRFGTLAFRTATPVIEAMSNVWLRRIYGDPQRISPGTLEGYKAPLSIPGMWQYGLGVVGCWQNDLRELEDAYMRIQQPTLLMWGDRDVAVYASSASEVKKRIAQAELKVLGGAGHLPYEEVPEEFNRELRAFLR